MKIRNKITPCLWFDDKAGEAAEFYCSLFPDSEIQLVQQYPDGITEGSGKVLMIKFRLGNQEFLALNGGQMVPFTEAVSFSIDCETQEEIDHFWERLSEGGEESMCGWLKDRFGLSWQIVPDKLSDWLYQTDPARAGRAMQAMLSMKKIIIADLLSAVNY